MDSGNYYVNLIWVMSYDPVPMVMSRYTGIYIGSEALRVICLVSLS